MTVEDLELKILELMPDEFRSMFFSELSNHTMPPKESLLEAALQLLADDGYIEIRKARETPYGWTQYESYRKGMELASFIHGGGNFQIKVTPGGLRRHENLKRKERSIFESSFASAVVNEEGKDKQPMKSNVDNHTLAERSSVAYGDRASNNTAITGPVGRDIVLNVHPSPHPPGSVHEHKAKMEYDAALQLKRATLGVKNAISSVRSVNSGTDFQAKLNRIDESVSALHAELREGEVHWEEKVWQISMPLKLCALKLQQYIRRHTRQSAHMSASDSEEIERIIWEDDPENDPFTQEIKSAVGQIISFLDPYLNPLRG